MLRKRHLIVHWRYFSRHDECMGRNRCGDWGCDVLDQYLVGNSVGWASPILRPAMATFQPARVIERVVGASGRPSGTLAWSIRPSGLFLARRKDLALAVD